MIRGGNGDVLLGAHDVDGFGSVDAGLSGLALAAELALGGMKFDAGFLVGFVGVGGNALGE